MKPTQVAKSAYLERLQRISEAKAAQAKMPETPEPKKTTEPPKGGKWAATAVVDVMKTGDGPKKIEFHAPDMLKGKSTKPLDVLAFQWQKGGKSKLPEDTEQPSDAEEISVFEAIDELYDEYFSA